MAKAYLSLGTNLGDKEANMHTAIQFIDRQIGKVISQSAFYITAPWGFQSANSFLNSAISINTSLSPAELLKATQLIEREMGRTHKSINGNYSDRLIDIDILLYDEIILNSEELTIPHPQIANRLFVLEPLAEIAPNLICSGCKESIAHLLDKLKENKNAQ